MRQEARVASQGASERLNRFTEAMRHGYFVFVWLSFSAGCVLRRRWHFTGGAVHRDVQRNAGHVWPGGVFELTLENGKDGAPRAATRTGVL
jgi:hypothetical protein